MSEEMKATAGPWHTFNGCYVCANMPGNVVIAECGGFNRAADTALIAAAPDLLEVARRYEQWEARLIECSEAWETQSGLPRFTQELYNEFMAIQALRNAAIAKATGKGTD